MTISRMLRYLPIVCVVAFTIMISGCTGPNVATPTAEPSISALTPTPVVSTAPVATALPPHAPSAYFTTGKYGDSSKTVAFTDESLYSPTSWSWTFGDGFVSAEPSPVHIYKDTGDYQVSLRVTNAAGSDTITQTISIKATPTPEPGYATVLPTTVAPGNVQISAVYCQIKYADMNDTYFGSATQVSTSVPTVPAGASVFHYSLKLTNNAWGTGHRINSIMIGTSGFSLVSVDPVLPTSLINPGSDITLDLTIHAPSSAYAGPLAIVIIPS